MTVVVAPSSPTQRIAVLVEQARSQRNGAPALGAQAAREAAALARDMNSPEGPLWLARALSQLAVCLRNVTELVAAAQVAQEATALFATLPEPWPREHAEALISQGIALTMLGRAADALALFETARDLSRAAGDAAGEANALLDIAVVANVLGDDDKAVALYRQVLPIYEGLGDHHRRASALNNMAYAQVCRGMRQAEAGDTAAAQGQFTAAVAGAEMALPLAEASGQADFIVSCLDTLSAALRELGQFDRAQQTLARQLALTRQLAGRRMEAVTLGNWGEVQRRAGQTTAALTTLQQADQLFSQLQLAEEHATTLLSLVDTYEALGRLAEALATHRRFHALQQRLRADEAQHKLQTLESRLKLERSEAELALSRQRSEELAALNERLLAVDTEREALVHELQRLSTEDALTGLANRRAFDIRLAMEVERARRYQRPLSVAMLDVDHFKQINDQGSHAMGDQVLRSIAEVLRLHTRPTDLAARLGGDELVLLLPDTELADAVTLCRHLGQQMSSVQWHQWMPLLQPTLSVGIASLDVQAGVAAAEPLLAAADAQLYRAKALGRNWICSAIAQWPFWPL